MNNVERRIVDLALPALLPKPIQLSYLEWPVEDPSAPSVICVHGLTRNARDFDFLARDLQRHFRVICPDMPGRGQSPDLPDSALYTYPTYITLCLQLLDRLGLETVDWIGTSMGGLIGMMIAAHAPARIRRLVLNDIGAFVPKSGLERLKTYVGVDMTFATRAEAEAVVRKNLAAFGMIEETHWRHMLDISLRDVGDGKVSFAYDPEIRQPLFQSEVSDVNLWEVWDRITHPQLLLRGVDSDILPHETAARMAQRENVTLIEIPHCGHAPALMNAEQIGFIREFLRACSDLSFER